MQAIPTLGFEQIAGELLRGIIETVADTPGLPPERKAAAQQTVVCSVMAFNPRDPVETMMAGQCVVYDHMLRHGAREMLRGQAELVTIQARPGILACGKTFLATVAMLVRMQRRSEAQLAFARPLPVQQDVADQSASVPNDTGETPPVAARPGGPATPAASAAPRDPPRTPGPAPTLSPPAAAAHDAARGVAPSLMRDRPAPDQPVGARTAPVPGRDAPERRPDASVPPSHAEPPLMSQELIEEILFDGIDPALKQEILAAASVRAARGGF